MSRERPKPRDVAALPEEVNRNWRIKIPGVLTVALFILLIVDLEQIDGVHYVLSETFLLRITFIILITVLVWEGNFAIYRSFDRRMPWERNSRRRVLLQASVSSAYTVVAIALPTVLAASLFPDGLQFTTRALILGIFMSVCINAIYIGFQFFGNWRASQTETEQLKRQSAESRYEALRNQVNPHFLFNSLNTLLTLIEENPRTAMQFTEKLASVYRSILQLKDRDFISVRDELEAVAGYIYLLEHRFGDKLHVEIDVPVEYEDCEIAPLTLQMLVENAVKHNVVSREHHLHITIRVVDGERLLVSNNRLPRRSTRESARNSTRVGLQNIRDRYEFLNGSGVEVTAEEREFTVSIPLLRKRIVSV